MSLNSYYLFVNISTIHLNNANGYYLILFQMSVSQHMTSGTTVLESPRMPVKIADSQVFSNSVE